MITLGICVLGDEHAAVVASDGTVVSAVCARGAADGVGACTKEALTIVGVDLDRVDRVLSTTAHCAEQLERPVEVVGLYDALAAQLRSMCPAPRSVVIVDDADAGAIVTFGQTTEVVPSPALRTVARVASVLGLPSVQ